MFKSIGSYSEVKNHFIPFEVHFLLGGGKTDNPGKRKWENSVSLDSKAKQIMAATYLSPPISRCHVL